MRSVFAEQLKNETSAQEEKKSPQIIFLQDVDKNIKKIGKSLENSITDLEIARSAFRDLHTFKGSASMNNLGQVVDVIHKCENNIEKVCTELENKSEVADDLVKEIQSNIISITEVINSEMRKREKKAKRGSRKRRSEAS